MEPNSSQRYLEIPLWGSGHRWYCQHLLILATAGTPVPQEMRNKGSFVTMEVPRLEHQGSPDGLQSQSINWTVSSLSKEASRDFSVPGHQREDYNQLSYAANWYQASLFLREVSEGTKPREVKRNEQRSTDVPECEEGRDHLHPRGSSGEQSHSSSNVPPLP